MIAGAEPTTAAGSELAWVLVAVAAVYFAPTLLAVARHRGAAPLTFSFNLLLGWTGVGWLVAWMLAFADRRWHILLASASSVSAEPSLLSVTLAPDGRHWWDGGAWQDGWNVAPVGALRSPDDAQWFSGAQWVALSAASPTRVAANSRATRGPTGRTRLVAAAPSRGALTGLGSVHGRRGRRLTAHGQR